MSRTAGFQPAGAASAGETPTVPQLTPERGLPARSLNTEDSIAAWKAAVQREPDRGFQPANAALAGETPALQA